MDIKPNDICICGKGKYKRCYGNHNLDENECEIFLQEIYKKSKPGLQSFIDSIVEEAEMSISRLDKDAIRCQLIICFSIIDTFSKIRSDYNGFDLKNKERMVEWMKQFLLVQENNEFNNLKELKCAHAEGLYSLRCSLMHAFSLSKKYRNTYFMIVNFDPLLDTEGMDRLGSINSFLKKKKYSCVYIFPKKFLTMIYSGALLMLEKVNKIHTKEEKVSLLGFKRLYINFLKEEGATIINL